MNSAKRFASLAALMAALVLTPVTDVNSAEPRHAGDAGELCQHRRHGGAIGGAVHGSRQGADLARAA